MREILNDLEHGSHLSDPDPTKRAQNAMKAPVVKRFYRDVTISEEPEGFGVHLDGKPVRTPGHNALRLPTRAAAQLVGDEFAAQSETFNPVSMPVMRLVNTAIDGVATDPQAVLEDILRFASTDLLFYRADGPDRLVVRQGEAWDPVLDWAREVLGARFFLAEGVMHVEQPRESIAAVGRHLKEREDALTLAALHVMTTLTGSALIALAVEAGEIDSETGWTAAHVDEDWNVEQWGEDFEAAARRKTRKAEMMSAVRLLEALKAVE
ncbi:ATP12 family chaperone protein [Arvimicrobium flavum]|uniref:ATP12 family chaperone protein n=1 Tax=Arvimicrobium flavum TaxID=3393320 RepID=UPI00237B4BAA|nr:ATP12 family protein [Mesorhizobium shangrilense]